MRLAIITAAAFLSSVVAGVFGFGSSCWGRCRQQPSLIDYLNPVGCYCHSTCGSSLKCCSNKARYCGGSFGSFGSGGSQACSLPKKVRNAKIVGGEKLFYARGDTITYKCNFHYVMKGMPTRTCLGLSAGAWSPAPPRCEYEIFVCRPPSITNGAFNVNQDKKEQYLRNERVTVQCNRGYELKGSNIMYCSGFSWKPLTGLASYCVKECSPKCHEDATCIQTSYTARCSCKEGFEGSGYLCWPKPCHKHTCSANEKCIDAGDRSGDYTCACKTGYLRIGGECKIDPCLNNDCSLNASCMLEDDGGYSCECNSGFIGNGTVCKARLCDPSNVYGEQVELPCADCEEICCDNTTLRECRVCIHTACNGGEVCEENSRVKTICSANECLKNDNGFTVDAPDFVKCLGSDGTTDDSLNCCWTGERRR